MRDDDACRTVALGGANDEVSGACLLDDRDRLFQRLPCEIGQSDV